MNNKFISLPNYEKHSPTEMLKRSKMFYDLMRTRRSVREFSREDVPTEIIDGCILTAGTAPSGANQQPWHFVVVKDLQTKQAIRQAAEQAEQDFYAGRAGDTWLETLEPLGTNAEKPFLENAPVLIAIFEQKYRIEEIDGQQTKHYYSKESTGIATGLLIAALHNAGLVTLTHTPSPMNFLSKILKRPSGERPFLLLVVGYPAENVLVPDIDKKTLNEIRTTR
ncbi:MAG: nitroreductase family protein [Candidatus Marinimicrobia bacterium]|nr:nitroreductase family protein [Candidatus Neomarinimicrobiota bacterium]